MTIPLHLQIAMGELGVEEWKGRKHNPRILEYHATTTLGDWGRSRDETPSCSSFVNWCMTEAGIEGTDNALARSWIRWGALVRPKNWQLGDICVIKRKRRGSDRRTGSVGGYHVAFPVRIDGRSVILLGSNQSDKVQFSSYSMRRYALISVRREPNAYEL